MGYQRHTGIPGECVFTVPFTQKHWVSRTTVNGIVQLHLYSTKIISNLAHV
jgi:hypothetical protein